MLLKDKTVFLTGAGRGIGSEILQVCLREGATVVAHMGRTLPAGPAATGTVDTANDNTRTLLLAGDLAEPRCADELWAQAVAWRGRIDAVINNAGAYIASPMQSADDWDAGWKHNMTLNLDVPAAFCRHAMLHFQDTGEGIVVNMASRSSHRGDDIDHLAYGAAKGGLLALTKGIARSYATHRTLAYAVAPAWVLTGMAEEHIASVGEAKLTAHLPMGEITPPGDVAETVAFLASGRARHATGCTIDVTGADYVR